MRFYTDDYFHIGTSHLGMGAPCQDYALSRSSEDGSMAYAIVSDGCSTGGRTDSGARVVAHTAEVAIRDEWQRNGAPQLSSIPEMTMQQKILMQSAKENLGLVREDLLATCMYAYVSAKGGFVHVRGDGVIAFVHPDGAMFLRRYNWANNMPLYPAYAGDNFARFINAHGGLDKEALTEERWWYQSEKGFVNLGSCVYSIRKSIGGITTQLKESSGINGYKYVAVFTDGVTEVDGMDWKEAVLSLVSFKNVAGSFAKRRMISFIKDARKYGKGPIDDIAYAVIRVSENEE